MTLAAVDRLVHHATIFEMNVESSAAAPRWNENEGQVDRLHVRPSKQALDRRATTIKKDLRYRRATTSMLVPRSLNLLPDCRDAST